MAEETIFEKILKGDIPSSKVYEDDSVFAFRDINPEAPVHVLVIPKKRAVCISDVKEWSAEETGLFLQGVARTAHQLGLDGPGYRVVFNNGSNAGQDVPYLHAHILGGRRMSWPPG